MNDDHTFAPEMTAEEAIQMVLKRPEMYGLQRVTAVPDVATAAEAFRDLGIKHKAERDAALAAVERVRVLHRVAYSGNSRSRNAFCATCTTTWPCATIRALDGAPEPEWEYGMQDDYGLSFMRNIAEAYDHANRQDPELNPRPVRRRKAGPWLPVEGESNGG